MNVRFKEKADLIVVKDLEKVTCRRNEIEETKELIVNLNDRVKHLSILQSELASSINPLKNKIGCFNEVTQQQIF